MCCLLSDAHPGQLGLQAILATHAIDVLIRLARLDVTDRNPLARTPPNEVPGGRFRAVVPPECG